MEEMKSKNARKKARRLEDVLFVPEKVTGFDALVAVCHIAYKKLEQTKREEKQKVDAILGDGKIDGPVREKAVQKPAGLRERSYSVLLPRAAGERLLSSANKSGGTAGNGGAILRRRFDKVNEPMSDQVHGGFTTRKRTSEERPSCSA
ncbi:hypothetical protein NC653_034275 [Populus alba x Populus x berolinensis]|uniref:Uncharacterized protein n=1 Tax=Populus alba x Populus x berolinensis TaxID=444605 RepID=A0AAD6LM63_9ROSI|nr:hypothetical protein NC653_034275 [Populus alba x Populus x berolinensis]